LSAPARCPGARRPCRADPRPGAGRSIERLAADLARPRGRDSLANHLRRRAGIEGVKAALLRELCPPETLAAPALLAAAIKALAVPVGATRPIDEAISTAGGSASPPWMRP
jgi:predicted flavoprotein YhiN